MNAPAIRLDVSDLEGRLHEDRSTTYRRYTQPDPENPFPPPHYLGGRRFWWLGEIEAWEAREMARGPTRKSNLPKVKAARAKQAEAAVAEGAGAP